jgi:hypothetical protein
MDRRNQLKKALSNESNIVLLNQMSLNPYLAGDSQSPPSQADKSKFLIRVPSQPRMNG